MRANKGFHPRIEDDHEHMFIDACTQVWPDADYDVAHDHGVTAYGVTGWDPLANVEEALNKAMYWHLVARENDNLELVESADDIRSVDAEGKAGLIIASQDGAFIDNDLSRIEAFYKLGLRYLIPTYNRSNNICDGCLDRNDHGLTAFGERVVEECNRLGLLLDCSHLSEQSSLDIIEHSEQPVIFSHSNVKSIVDNPRNITDAQIDACIEADGVICLAPFGPFTLKDGETEWPSIEDFMDHVDYVVDRAGSTDYIGIGTDMSLGTYPYHDEDPWGEPEYKSWAGAYSEHVSDDVRSPKRALRDFNSFPDVVNFIDALQARGYTNKEVGKMLGGNLLRIFDRVWQ